MKHKERDFRDRLKLNLERNEFFVQVLKCNSSNLGLPDLLISKHHKGFFAELKYEERKFEITHFINKSIFLPNSGKKNQMMKMLELDEHFLARYILCIETASSKLIYLIAPSKVFSLVEYGVPIELKNGEILPIFIQSLHDFLQISP